jgi:hypothetical protein
MLETETSAMLETETSAMLETETSAMLETETSAMLETETSAMLETASMCRAGFYRPSGWRATKPAVEVIELDQRVPVSACATVSKRLPSITMKACSASA